jgi:hypothetical protein
MLKIHVMIIPIPCTRWEELSREYQEAVAAYRDVIAILHSDLPSREVEAIHRRAVKARGVFERACAELSYHEGSHGCKKPKWLTSSASPG